MTIDQQLIDCCWLWGSPAAGEVLLGGGGGSGGRRWGGSVSEGVGKLASHV